MTAVAWQPKAFGLPAQVINPLYRKAK